MEGCKGFYDAMITLYLHSMDQPLSVSSKYLEEGSRCEKTTGATICIHVKDNDIYTVNNVSIALPTSHPPLLHRL